jgi:MFS family permease
LADTDVPVANGHLAPEQQAAHLSDSTSGVTFSQFRILVAAGAFATTIAQVKLVGRLPLQTLLKNHYNFNATQIATFMGIAVFAWNLKPFAGILTDAFPLFRTRRRHYMMLAAGAAGLCWLVMGLVWGHYPVLLTAAVALNVFMVISSTVMGGLMVEAGQRYDAAGRITSLRQAVQSVGSLINGVLGGFLATIAFGWTAGVGAFLLFLLVPLTFKYLREKPLAERDTHVLTNAWAQLKTIAKARSLWIAALFVFLFYMAPGFNTPLYFLQIDQLKFSTKYIGLIETVAGAMGIGSALLYGVFCKKLNLRAMLTIGIGTSAAWTMMYVFYGRTNAMAIDAVSTLVGVIAEVAMMDLAVRATPKGCEALGFSLMMSVRNFALTANDILGSWLIDHHHWQFKKLVVVNAGTTALVLVLIPLLPRVLMSRREGDAGK